MFYSRDIGEETSMSSLLHTVGPINSSVLCTDLPRCIYYRRDMGDDGSKSSLPHTVGQIHLSIHPVYRQTFDLYSNTKKVYLCYSPNMVIIMLGDSLKYIDSYFSLLH